MQKPSHLFFDLDNTIAEKCGVVSPEMIQRLESREASVIVVSGATVQKIESQLNGLMPDAILAQNGNHAFLRSGDTYREIWKNEMGECLEVWDHIWSLMLLFQGGEVQHRGCQISYSPTGHNADAAKKKAFDPDFSRRRIALQQYPFRSHDFVVSLAGTTCFDYIRQDGTKGINIASFLKFMGWDADSCVYYGDALHEQGNDHSVIGVIPTIAVDSPADTFSKL